MQYFKKNTVFTYIEVDRSKLFKQLYKQEYFLEQFILYLVAYLVATPN